MALVNDTHHVSLASRCVGTRRTFISQQNSHFPLKLLWEEEEVNTKMCWLLFQRGSLPLERTEELRVHLLVFVTSNWEVFSVHLSSCSLLCSREAVCLLVIREKSPKYYKEGGNASRDLFEWGMCHVDVLLCCGCSSSSCLSVFSLMFLLRIQRGSWWYYMLFSASGESLAPSGETVQVSFRSGVHPVDLGAELFHVGCVIWVEVFWVQLNVDSVLNYGWQT